MRNFSFNDLQDALATFNWSDVESICRDLVEEVSTSSTPFDGAEAKKILSALRRKRQFKLMSEVADALINVGQSSPQILRLYAQSMIEQGNFTAARGLLESIISDAGSSPEEWAEAQGLMGRIYKQLYVNANDPAHPRQQENLRKSIECYYSIYKSDPRKNLWPGINTVALLARAERDHVSVPGLVPMRDIAREIDGFLKELSTLEYWDRATAIEDAVALGNPTAAYDHALHYVIDPRADAFEIASLLRQLKEVWQLSPEKEPGNTLLPILQTALLKRQGGNLTVEGKISADSDATVNARAELTRIFGVDSYQPLGWMKVALKRCEAVGKVQNLKGQSLGTGFLVKASDFFVSWKGDELLFLTCAYIISPDDRRDYGALAPQSAKVVFEATGREY